MEKDGKRSTFMSSTLTNKKITIILKTIFFNIGSFPSFTKGKKLLYWNDSIKNDWNRYIFLRPFFYDRKHAVPNQFAPLGEKQWNKKPLLVSSFKRILPKARTLKIFCTN